MFKNKEEAKLRIIEERFLHRVGLTRETASYEQNIIARNHAVSLLKALEKE